MKQLGLILIELAAKCLASEGIGIDLLAVLFPFLAQDIDIDHLAIDQLEIVDADDGLDGGHLFGLQLLVNLFRDKEHAAFGMGCNLVDVVRGELMQKGNSHSTISSDCKEANSPMAAVLRVNSCRRGTATAP